MDHTRSRLIGITAVASEFCTALENAAESSKEDFLVDMTTLLPKIYLEFADLAPESDVADPSPDILDDLVPLEMQDEESFPSYVDEIFYDSVRRNVEALLGPDDTFLETFEEDMKYSDSPIAASISESLADIFQSLYNFVSYVRDCEGENIVSAYIRCREDFVAYWAQSLCNVMRPLNNLRFG